jgi:hypothetical protein
LLLNVTTLENLLNKKETSKDDLLVLKNHYWNSALSHVTRLALDGNEEADKAYNDLKAYETLITMIKNMEIKIGQGN